ncbi:glucose PTS transporter subunit EIIB, partial [Photobacterium sp. OFAV2-7]|uniref:glucose PTS transporter subunit EIIB n=1 Tax=Photobacterium sp. OFAV2-7 TaxID=2917748 RepID=UPI001EF6E75C
ALLSATMATLAYTMGISGNFQTGLIDFVFQNWLPLGANHMGTYVIQIVIGLSFTAIYFFLFRTLILKYNIMTPGRDNSEAKLYTKADYKASKSDTADNAPAIDSSQAVAFIEGLGGSGNIELLTNCATRLRIKVKDPDLVKPTAYFQQKGAVNVVRNGDSFQIIVGLTVPQVKEEMAQVLQTYY